ncbi:MAG: transglutaminase-like domain-containing protein [candidate division WOR-3 bacterium]
MNFLLAKEVTDFIEKKRIECAEELLTWFKKTEITNETYHECLLYNEQLSELLKTIFIKGEKLIQKKIVDTFSALWEYEKKPQNEEEAFEVMRQLIREGSENPCVRKFALDIAEKCSKDLGIPVVVPPVEELYSKALTQEEIKYVNAFISHCEKVARNIYERVRSKMVYVSDPPDDYYQKAYYTLEILDFKGDCDDFAILICSLLRSIGYRTFLGFQPNHVFAGVILAKSFHRITHEKDSIEYIEVPLDPQIEDFEINVGSQKIHFNVFDILNGDFIDQFSEMVNQQIYVMSEDALKRMANDIEKIHARLSDFARAKVLFVDQPIKTTKIVTIFKKEFLKCLSF